MAGWNRLTRNLFDAVTSSDIVATGAESLYGLAANKYATYANGAANVANTTGGKKGLKTASVASKGSMPLWGQQASGLRLYGNVFLSSSVNSNSGVVYCGVVVLAQDDNATPANARYVFCGLRMDALGTNRQWIIALMNDTGEITRYASMTAASLGASQGVNGAFKVILSTDGHTIKLRTNRDGEISADVSADLASLGTWWGARFISTQSVTNTALLESFDVAKWDTTYTPVNAAWDRVRLLPNFTPILEFMPGSEVLLAPVSTPAYDPDDVVFGANSMYQSGNPISLQKWDLTLPTPLDLSTNACLALCCKPIGPGQQQYTTSTLAIAANAGDATLHLVSTSGMGTGANGGYVDIGAGGVGVFFTGISGNDLTGCTWVNGVGTYAIGTHVAQHNGNQDPPCTLSLELAASAAERTAGNYIQLRSLTVGQGTWQVATFMVNGSAGVEGRLQGTATAAILSSIGFIRCSFSCTTALPYTGTGYDGPQPATTPGIKWDVLGKFDYTSKPTVCFSFDDSHDSDGLVVAPELEKIRPGFPSGMRGTFYVIVDNVDTTNSVTRAQYKRLSANGHEVALHSSKLVHHGSGDAGGDGPMSHYEVAYGLSNADLTTQLSYLKSNLGIPGPFTYAYPYGNANPVVAANANALGIKASRTLNGGGGVATITGSGGSADCTGFDKSTLQTRFLTEPVGDIHRLPSLVMAKDLNTNDNLGHRIAERFILEACQQGMKAIISDHQMYPHGTPSAFSGSWSADQFAEVLDYISDLKTGGNTSGRNGAANHFPTLTVQTVVEAVSGTPPVRAAPEAFGVAI